MNTLLHLWCKIGLTMSYHDLLLLNAGLMCSKCPSNIFVE